MRNRFKKRSSADEVLHSQWSRGVGACGSSRCEKRAKPHPTCKSRKFDGGGAWKSVEPSSDSEEGLPLAGTLERSPVAALVETRHLFQPVRITGSRYQGIYASARSTSSLRRAGKWRVDSFALRAKESYPRLRGTSRAARREELKMRRCPSRRRGRDVQLKHALQVGAYRLGNRCKAVAGE
jgi:hypothetical protein